MKDKLHVLIIPTWYPIGYDKLMGVYHKDFCDALNKRDDVYSNILYVQRHRLKKPWEYFLDKKWKDIDEGRYHTYIRPMLNVGPISKIWQLKRYAKALDKAFIKYVKINGKPDILHAQVIVPAGYAAKKLSEKYNIPLIITEHTSDTARARLTREPYAQYGKYAIKDALYTGVSQNILDIIGDAAYNMKVLPNSVDLSIFNSSSPKEPNGYLDMVTVCALRSDKGIDDLADALKILETEYKLKDFHLNVVGDGEEELYYKQYTTQKGMDKHVTFVGRKNREEVSKFISQSDLLVMPSHEETFGIPPIEAMACGVPVVSTKCGAPEEYMDEKCGELCNVKDAKSLADAIYKAYKKIGTYDRAYLKSVANRFSEKEVTDLAMKYYMEILNR